MAEKQKTQNTSLTKIKQLFTHSKERDKSKKYKRNSSPSPNLPNSRDPFTIQSPLPLPQIHSHYTNNSPNPPPLYLAVKPGSHSDEISQIKNSTATIIGDTIAWILCDTDCNPNIYNPDRTARVVKYTSNPQLTVLKGESIVNSQMIIPQYDPMKEDNGIILINIPEDETILQDLNKNRNFINEHITHIRQKGALQQDDSNDDWEEWISLIASQAPHTPFNMSLERYKSLKDINGELPYQAQLSPFEDNPSDHSQDEDSNCSWLIIFTNDTHQNITEAFKLFLDNQGFSDLEWPSNKYLIDRDIDHNTIWAYILCKQQKRTTVAFVQDEHKQRYLNLVYQIRDMSSTYDITLAKLKTNPKDATALSWHTLNRYDWPNEVYDLIEAHITTQTAFKPRKNKIQNTTKHTKSHKIHNTPTREEYNELKTSINGIENLLKQLTQTNNKTKSVHQQNQLNYDSQDEETPNIIQNTPPNPNEYSHPGNNTDNQATDEELDNIQNNYSHNHFQPRVPRNKKKTVVIKFNPETMILPDSMKNNPSTELRNFFNKLAYTRGDIPNNSDPSQSRMPMLKVQIAPIFTKEFRIFENTVMPQAASKEFAAWYRAYREVSAGKAVSVLQNGYKASLQNIASDLAAVKQGSAMLAMLKLAAPILINKNIKSLKRHEVSTFFHDSRMFSFSHGFNNTSFWDYCMQPRTVGPDIMEIIIKKCTTPSIQLQIVKQVTVYMEQIIMDCLSKGMDYEDLKDQLVEKHTIQLLKTNADGEYLNQHLDKDAFMLMQTSPTYIKERSTNNGVVDHDREQDLTATTKRELLNKIMLDTGMKTKLRTMYMPLAKDFDSQPDDDIVRDTKKVLDVAKETVRNSEKLEDRISRITRKNKTPRGKPRSLMEEFYPNAAPHPQTRSRPNMKQDIRPETKPAHKEMCNSCKNKIGRGGPVSDKTIEKICLRDHYKPPRPSSRKASPSTGRRKPRHPSTKPTRPNHKTKTPYHINATNTFQNQDHDLEYHKIRSTQEHHGITKEWNSEFNDELALELSHRKFLMKGISDINHKFNDHTTHNSQDTDNEDEESDPETVTSGSDTDQEENSETSEDSEHDSASD